LSLLGSANFMRLSLEKGAHAVLSSAAWQESGDLSHFLPRTRNGPFHIPRVGNAGE
jgi:hypothetical protein